MAKLRLLWPRDVLGYRIEPAPATKRRKPVRKRSLLERGWPEPQSPTILEDASRPGDPPDIWIERNGGQLEFYNCLDVDGLWKTLADTEPTEDGAGALEFVSNHGFLRAEGRESVARINNEIKVARFLVAAIDREDWSTLDHWLLENRDVMRLNPEFRQVKGWPRPDLFFRPRDLLDAIYLQALQDATSGTDLRKCDRPGCPEYRAVGPGTDRWRTKRKVWYCSPKCQKAHAYMKLKGGSK